MVLVTVLIFLIYKIILVPQNWDFPFKYELPYFATFLFKDFQKKSLILVAGECQIICKLTLNLRETNSVKLR